MIEVLLAAAGLGGLVLLLQSKSLPSKEDAEKAFEVLDKTPLDLDANTVFGKYKAFVMGDYDGAMPYLVNSKDVTLKSLADHELDQAYTATPQQKVGMGDEWVKAAGKMPALSRIFYDRAAYWYGLAWPDLDQVWKQKSRIQGLKLSASRPPGMARKGLPTGWVSDKALAGTDPVIDGNVARSGSYSIKLLPADPKAAGSLSVLKSPVTPISGKALEMSTYVFSDGTENKSDRMFLEFIDMNGGRIGLPYEAFFPIDTPFWKRVSIKSPVPENAAGVRFSAVLYSKKGNLWVDDVSVKVDGKEAMKNGSFEDK
jgi:hypothetical protein